MYYYSNKTMMNRKFRRTEFIWNTYFSNIINVFIITFDQFKASLLKKSIDFYNPPLKKKTYSKLLNGIEYNITNYFYFR